LPALLLLGVGVGACAPGATRPRAVTAQRARSESGPKSTVTVEVPKAAPAAVRPEQAGPASDDADESGAEAPESVFHVEPDSPEAPVADPPPSPARPAPAVRPSSAAPSAAASRLQRARERFREGAEAYQRGDYATARTRFLQAHRLKPEPLLLYNLAMVAWRLGNQQRACQLLRQAVAQLGASASPPITRGDLARQCKLP
jgi:hypothetical protein